MLTHVPVLGSIFGLFLLVLGIVRKDPGMERIALWVLVLAGIATVPTYLSGRPAGMLLGKALPGMSMDAGDQHAEIAILALGTALLCGLAALSGIAAFRRCESNPGWFTSLVLVLALVTTASMVWTASLGGKIRHTEIGRLEYGP